MVCEVVHGYRLKCLTCKAFFSICTSCFRGHRYCGHSCRQASRFESLRVSRRIYAQKPEAKILQGRRQRRYRQRLKNKVTDQGSKTSIDSVSKNLQSFAGLPKPKFTNCRVCSHCGGAILAFHQPWHQNSS